MYQAQGGEPSRSQESSCTVHGVASYPIPEAAFLLGISRSGLYDLINAGSLMRIKIGRRTLIPAAEIERIVALPTTTQGTDNDLHV